ncbi:LacI family DNA-binding transcriptional regulator [Lampropedia cohaerens]|uniref:LacI family DNA-binding transcriptional regulator n=1 Tax=Lampropedia cohaerens TaxID=1610491 RepID=UPI0018D23FE3|nr:LacI family DNA-binding transcriptional regulator [Lampropedia cohaerens]
MRCWLSPRDDEHYENELADFSRESAVKKSQPARAPTLEDVARSAGLSPMTVSRALNAPHLVRPKTVEKVMQAVRTTGYIPNARRCCAIAPLSAATPFPSLLRTHVSCVACPSA